LLFIVLQYENDQEKNKKQIENVNSSPTTTISTPSTTIKITYTTTISTSTVATTIHGTINSTSTNQTTSTTLEKKAEIRNSTQTIAVNVTPKVLETKKYSQTQTNGITKQIPTIQSTTKALNNNINTSKTLIINKRL
jgi:hypothetical protein